MIEPGLNRRDFIRTVVLTAAAIVLVPKIGEADTGAPAAKATYIDLGAAKGFGETWTKVVLPKQYNEEVIYVRKVVADKTPVTYQAISARCTHKGCTVAYADDVKQFKCPCHGAVFGADAQNVSGPGRHPEFHLDPLHPLLTQVGKTKHLLVAAPVIASTSDD